MADVLDSERFGKRVKHKRKSHYVGGLFGPVKVGSSYEVEPLPENMQEEPEEAGREDSHSDMIADLRNNFGLPSKYINETHFDLYEKGLCPYCERKLSGRVCKTFASMVSSQAVEHFEPCCCECGEWLEEFKLVRVVGHTEASTNLSESPHLPTDLPSAEEKVQAQPCECIMDEERMFWQADVPENEDNAEDRLKNLRRNENEQQSTTC